MKMYRINRLQFIKADIERVWEFFSNPHNLAILTPGYMQFRVTSEEVANKIFTGQIITYKVSPILGIPLSWKTEITDVDDYKRFTDEQREGPYKLWRHMHTFEQRKDGVMMTDEVQYSMPLGFIGIAAHRLFVKKQLEDIFDHRYRQVERIFNT